ncbi:MAG: hypothetical protein ACJ786_02640 [Catenulispora sp.]
MERRELIPDRVVLMWDWSSSGLWHADHREFGVSAVGLGLSEATQRELREWIAYGESLTEREMLGGKRRRRSKSDRRFREWSYRLWAAIRREAPPGVAVGNWHEGEVHWAPGEGFPELDITPASDE